MSLPITSSIFPEDSPKARVIAIKRQRLISDILCSDEEIAYPPAEHLGNKPCVSTRPAVKHEENLRKTKTIMVDVSPASTMPSSGSSVSSGTAGHKERLEAIKDAGIKIHLPRTMSLSSGFAGALFAHGERACLAFIETIGGSELAVFKIGITANIVQRWGYYREQNYDFMSAIACLEDLTMIECLEAHLIRIFRDYAGIRNEVRGGEGLRKASGEARFSGPYYTYITGTPANVRYPIGA